MSERDLEGTDVQPVRHSNPTKRNFVRPTIGLSTVLLGVAAIAVGMGNWQIDKKINHLERQMPGLRRAARELVVDDSAMLAVVKRRQQWYGESIFDVHLPNGESWRLCMALDKVGDKDLAKPLASLPLSPGLHAIEVRYEKEKDESIASVLVDGVQVFKEVRPKDWEPREGSSGGANFNSSTKCDTTRPLVLYRRRFMQPTGPRSAAPPQQPSAGVLVWIEKLEGE